MEFWGDELVPAAIRLTRRQRDMYLHPLTLPMLRGCAASTRHLMYNTDAAQRLANLIFVVCGKKTHVYTMTRWTPHCVDGLQSISVVGVLLMLLIGITFPPR